MPFVDDHLALLEAVAVQQLAALVALVAEAHGVVAIAVPGNEVRRNPRRLAGIENVLEPDLVEAAERGTADLDRISELAFEALEDGHEELHELRSALGALRRELFLRQSFGALLRTPHVLDALRLVPDLPVLDIPLVAVRPAAVVVPHRAGEDLG